MRYSSQSTLRPSIGNQRAHTVSKLNAAITQTGTEKDKYISNYLVCCARKITEHEAFKDFSCGDILHQDNVAV